MTDQPRSKEENIAKFQRVNAIRMEKRLLVSDVTTRRGRGNKWMENWRGRVDREILKNSINQSPPYSVRAGVVAAAALWAHY